MTSLPRDNNPAEIRAFEATCSRLEGFDPDISEEWVDGFLTALAAGPQVPPQADWLQAMFADNFERAFADPPDHAQAVRSLRTRLSVLLDQLNPEALSDDPEQMRLNPLMSLWDAAERERVVASGAIDAEQAAGLLTGALWADGFAAAIEAFPDLWREPEDPEMAEIYQTMLTQVSVLMLDDDSEELKAHIARHYPKEAPDRETLVMDACYAAQDLRVFQMDSLPKPETRRVEKLPGRNDPCHCGSGKKFKKCHGAA